MADYIEKQKRLAKERAEFLDQHMEKVEENCDQGPRGRPAGGDGQDPGAGRVLPGRVPAGHRLLRPVVVGVRAVRVGLVRLRRGDGRRGDDHPRPTAVRTGVAPHPVRQEPARQGEGDAPRRRWASGSRRCGRPGSGNSPTPGPRCSVCRSRRTAWRPASGPPTCSPRATSSRSWMCWNDGRAPSGRGTTRRTRSPCSTRTTRRRSWRSGRGKQQADKLFDLAQKAVDAVRYVPPGPVYDPDRADVLRTAGGLACMAAMLDSPDDSWRAAYSPKASYAVRLLERAKTIHLDQGGQVREQLAVAYALAGRPAEAARLANQIKGSRKGSVAFLITLVRLHGDQREPQGRHGRVPGRHQPGVQRRVVHRQKRGLHRPASATDRYTAFTKPQFSVVLGRAEGAPAEDNRRAGSRSSTTRRSR